MKLFLSLFCLGLSLFAQSSTPTGSPAALNEAPYSEFFTTPIFVTGNDTYICYAKQLSAQSTITFSGISNANPGVVTATSHGMVIGASPTVTVSGGTGNWAALNGTWKVTRIDANSFSIPVNTTSFGAVTGTIVIKTTAPLLSSQIWAVQLVRTDGTNPTLKIWAVGGYGNRCDQYTSLSYQ